MYHENITWKYFMQSFCWNVWTQFVGTFMPRHIHYNNCHLTSNHRSRFTHIFTFIKINSSLKCFISTTLGWREFHDYCKFPDASSFEVKIGVVWPRSWRYWLKVPSFSASKFGSKCPISSSFPLQFSKSNFTSTGKIYLQLINKIIPTIFSVLWCQNFDFLKKSELYWFSYLIRVS